MSVNGLTLPPSISNTQDLQLPQLLRAALAHDCSATLPTAISDRVASLLSIQLQQQCPEHTHADPLASPTAVSTLLAQLLDPGQGPLALASQRVVMQALLGGGGGRESDLPGLAQLQQEGAWDCIPAFEVGGCAAFLSVHSSEIEAMKLASPLNCWSLSVTIWTLLQWHGGRSFSLRNYLVICSAGSPGQQRPSTACTQR